MTKVWFVREGPEPTRGLPAYDLPLTDSVDRLGLSRDQWLSGPDVRPRFGDQASRVAGVSDPMYVVCELGESEAVAHRWEPGFYVLEMSPREAAGRLSPPGSGSTT